MFKTIAAFFKREDAYARAGVKRVEGLANGVYDIAEREIKLIRAEATKVEAALKAEIAALKKQLSALKGQITKLSGKPAKARAGK